MVKVSREIPMTITRIFKVTINSDFRAEFEKRFNSLSKNAIDRKSGCIQVTVLGPTKWAPDDYAMISEWKNEAALVDFAGDDWNSSVIPAIMEKYALRHTVCHFESWK